MPTVADTAFIISVVRAGEAERPASERLFEDPYASLFQPPDAETMEAVSRFVDLPYVKDAVRLRTRFIDAFVREGLAAGLTQIVLLGAGFDTRALRLPEIAERRAAVYEIDFADQLERKRAVLAGAGIALPAHVAHVACDFAKPDFDVTLAVALEASGFRLGAGAVFVWEGVLPYIDDDAAARSLAFMARVGGQGSRVVFDFSPFSFVTVPAADRVRRAGFTSFEEVGIDAEWRRYLGGEPPPAYAILRMGSASL
jgi:methyltransferase (TIGR00027 family)